MGTPRRSRVTIAGTITLVIVALASVVVAGCGETLTRTELSDLQRRLEEQQRHGALLQHKVDDLENRVFLLTDQVETQKVAALHRSTRALPIVTIKADAANATAAAADPAAPGDEIVFEGEARSSDPNHARPVLRIDNSTRTAAHRLAPPATVEPSTAENLGVAPAPPIHAAATPTEQGAPAVEPLALYRAAYEELRAGRHDAAERGFREFVRRYPHHDYADNAQYWLGECFYDQKRYDKAAPEFRAVVQRWPTGNKAPDALLKLGFSLAALGDVDKARAALREVPAAYPRTEAARLASERLAQLTPTEGSK